MGWCKLSDVIDERDNVPSQMSDMALIPNTLFGLIPEPTT
jgi:hypothetical protein